MPDVPRERPARTAWGWRPLLWFWLAVLVVAGAGGSVLQWLGPPVRSLRAEAQPTPIPADAPVEAARAMPPQSPPPPPVQVEPAPSVQPPPTSDPGARDAAAGDVAKPRAPALVILYAANSDRSRAAAEQLVTRSGVAADQVEARATPDVPSPGVIRFYAEEDHAWARRLGQELSGLGYTWRIENLTGRAPRSEHPSVEVWLPDRRRSS